MVKPTSSSTCEKIMFQIGKENEDSEGLPFSSKYDGVCGVSRIPRINYKPAGVKRSCVKNCRIRWNNRQILQIETNFSPEEEDLIIKLHSTIGSRWSIIAQQLPGRTDNEVKNFWNKKLKKKLTAVGIDPITHRPFSQILADYGNINNNGGGGFTSHSKSRSHHFLGGALKKTEHHHQKQESSADFNNTHFLDSSKDQFFNGNGNGKGIGNGNSFDLLSQLQAIAMVTDYNSSKKNNYNSCCFQEIFVPFPVSDQLQSAAHNNNNNKAIIGQSATSSFSWCDFLLEDQFPPVIDYGEEQEINGGMKLLQGINEEFKKKSTGTGDHEEDYTASSGGGGSFVEAILETKTDEMLLLSDFHGFLDESF